jgi:hypothetical protein
MTAVNKSKGLLLKGKLTYEDFKMYNLYHTKRHTYFFIGGFMILGFVYTYITLPAFLFSLYMSLMGGGIGFLAHRIALNIRTRREYKSDQLLQKDCSYTINNTGISKKVNRTTTFLEWNYVQSAHEYQEMFCLYMSKNKAIVLPKSFFNSTSDIQLFKELVRQQLDTTKIKFLGE